MTQEPLDNTEQKIRDAACELFSERGLKGTTVRNVAEKAGVNIALVNYYFRSKDKLFLSVFKEKFGEYMQVGFHLLTNPSKSLSERISDFIEYFSQKLSEDQNILIFILSEIHYNNNLMDQLAAVHKEVNIQRREAIQKMLDEEHEQGNIRKVSAVHFELAIFSLMSFPFLSRSMMVKSGKLEGISFDDFIENWKQEVGDIVKRYLAAK